MATWYNIEIQMLGENERTYDLDEQIGNTLGFSEKDIDERELYKLTAIFKSDNDIDVMTRLVGLLLRNHPEIMYIDMLYRVADEWKMHRRTYWSEGRVQHYNTHIIYEEVE